MTERSHDIVLFGATGFTGELTAAYLAEHAGPGVRWALAGRNRAKLEAVAERLGSDVPLLLADATDSASLREVAESTRVVITTVGPYALHGEGLVAACAEAGTDYVDLTGEPEFVDTTYVRHHARAIETGARLVHACGFDSIPHDLGAQLTVEQLPDGVPVRVEGYVRMGGTFSGGTLASALTAFSRGRENLAAARARAAAEPRVSGRSVHSELMRPHKDPTGSGWALPAPLIDRQIICRSAAALPEYGPDFTYAHNLSVAALPLAAAVPVGVAGLMLAAQVGPLRRAVMARLPAGTGPSEDRRASSWFRVRFLGVGGGRRVVCEVSGGDPGYGETAKMLAVSALCLAQDDLPSTSGQVTTAQAMGPVLRERLVKAGLRFDVLEALAG